MKLAGKTREFKELIDRLETNFPASTWAEEGKKLLDEKNRVKKSE
jgi:hypothetical protein